MFSKGKYYDARYRFASVFMDPSISKSSETMPTPDETKSVEALVHLVATLQSNEASRKAGAAVVKKIPEVRPTSHWGLNE